MGAKEWCVETIRSGNNYYLLDADQYETGPLIAVLAAPDYHERLEKVCATGDATAMFESPEQYATLSQGELDAYVAYAAAGRLACIEEGQSVIAYENRRDLP